MKKIIPILSCCILSIVTVTSVANDCLMSAETQMEMNTCAAISYDDANKEMDRVIDSIRVEYNEDLDFLESMDQSQTIWKLLLSSNMDMIYPACDKQVEYGSSYSMCSNSSKLEMTFNRIEFLKKWLIGHDGQDVCTGSIKHEYCLNNDCSSLINSNKKD